MSKQNIYVSFLENQLYRSVLKNLSQTLKTPGQDIKNE